MISPLKMMQRIKHMKDDFEEDGRIQLHEFLDLILWSVKLGRDPLTKLKTTLKCTLKF